VICGIAKQGSRAIEGRILAVLPDILCTTRSFNVIPAQAGIQARWIETCSGRLQREAKQRSRLRDWQIYEESIDTFPDCKGLVPCLRRGDRQLSGWQEYSSSMYFTKGNVRHVIPAEAGIQAR